MTMTSSKRPSVELAIHTLEPDHALPTADHLAARREQIVNALREGANAGGRLAVFPEGAIGCPGKAVISRSAPQLDEADWSKVDWHALRLELGNIAAAARELNLWVVFGAPHQLSAGRRPHNSLYVISDKGELVTRYDKRRLSTTEINYMYTPGTEAVMFEVDGVRVGLILGLEVLFPDFFVDYADRGADLIVASSNGGGVFEQLVRSFATITGVTVALVVPAAPEELSATGFYAWNGPIAVVEDKSVAQTLVTTITAGDNAETFHFKARHGFYDTHLAPDEPRTRTRTTF